jgi:hypothetical protein
MDCTAAALRTQTGAVIPLLDSAAIETDQKETDLDNTSSSAISIQPSETL